MPTIQAIDARNQFRGKIVEIIVGSVVSEIEVETPSGRVASVITTRSVRDLGLRDRLRGHRHRQGDRRGVGETLNDSCNNRRDDGAASPSIAQFT